MASLLIQPDEAMSQDCFIRSNVPTTPGNGVPMHAGTLFLFGNSSFRRALMRLSLSELPAASQVSAAVLTLTIDTTPVSADAGKPTVGATFTASRITEPDWTEDATWSTYDGISGWSSSGGDFTETSQASVVYASGNTLDFDVLAMLQDAIAADLNYLDVLLRGPEVAGASNYVMGFSSASETASARPKLLLTYKVPALERLSYRTTREPLHYTDRREPLHWNAA